MFSIDLPSFIAFEISFPQSPTYVTMAQKACFKALYSISIHRHHFLWYSDIIDAYFIIVIIIRAGQCISNKAYASGHGIMVIHDIHLIEIMRGLMTIIEAPLNMRAKAVEALFQQNEYACRRRPASQCSWPGFTRMAGNDILFRLPVYQEYCGVSLMRENRRYRHFKEATRAWVGSGDVWIDLSQSLQRLHYLWRVIMIPLCASAGLPFHARNNTLCAAQHHDITIPKPHCRWCLPIILRAQKRLYARARPRHSISHSFYIDD